MPGLAVDTDVLDPFDATRLFDAFDLLEDSFRRHEEADDGAADLRPDAADLLHRRLSERSGHGEAVEVDADGRQAELRVVPAAETRGNLHHLRAVRPDPELDVASGRP